LAGPSRSVPWPTPANDLDVEDARLDDELCDRGWTTAIPKRAYPGAVSTILQSEKGCQALKNRLTGPQLGYVGDVNRKSNAAVAEGGPEVFEKSGREWCVFDLVGQ